jgi:hypothetical protein
MPLVSSRSAPCHCSRCWFSLGTNAAVIGTIWGMLRLVSGSLIVTSLAHGLWNAGAYVFFAFGTKTGALAVRNTSVYGPEVAMVPVRTPHIGCELSGGRAARLIGGGQGLPGEPANHWYRAASGRLQRFGSPVAPV